MPELPDLTVYREALLARVAGQKLLDTSIRSPFLLRTYDPPWEATQGLQVSGLSLLGKRIVFEFDDDLFGVLHLMIAGRLLWYDGSAAAGRRSTLAVFRFESGELLLTEASKKKRASLHLVRGRESLQDLDPGGADVFSLDLAEFAALLTAGNHTLKRMLTDPRVFSGIGNAYSDEILHRARLSPIQLTQKMTDEQVERLFEAVKSTLGDWIDRLRAEVGDGFPKKVTAFRPDMAVHGKYREPCPDCEAPVQRIVYRDNETNYCAACQTDGKVLADRAMSRLLKKDWPRTLEEWEDLRGSG